MSRLELGPEDNPNYVVDENGSGDLEVRDADGNVIATYTQDQTTEVGTLNAEQSGHIFPSGASDAKKALVETEDSDDTTNFDMDETGFDAYDVYVVRWHLQEHDSVGELDIQLRVDQNSTSNYVYHTGSTASTGQTEWKLGEVRRDRRSHGTAVVYAGGDTVAPPESSPMFRSKSTRSSEWLSASGRLEFNIAQISDLRLFTSGLATGRAWIKGYDMP